MILLFLFESRLRDCLQVWCPAFHSIECPFIISVADAKWVDYSPFWCTPLGRMLILRGTTIEECKSYCDEGCGAIEWWEGGSQACYLCTDLSLLMTFPHANDLSYPPHVVIKKPGMFYLPSYFCSNFCYPL